METNAPRIQPGETVEIVCGMHAGRVGTVSHTGITALYVEFTKPCLVTQPDGPKETVTLPFSSRELVRLDAERVPA